MEISEKSEMARILVGLAQIKPNGKITAESLDLWWMAMQDWPLDEFRHAAAHLARTVEFFPSPFHFEQLRKATGMSPSEAWAVALTHAAGAYRAGPSVPEVERAVAAMGGWRAIAMASTDSLAFVEKRFLEAFKESAERTESREALTALPSRGEGRGQLERAADRLSVGLRIVNAET